MCMGPLSGRAPVILSSLIREHASSNCGQKAGAVTFSALLAIRFVLPSDHSKKRLKLGKKRRGLRGRRHRHSGTRQYTVSRPTGDRIRGNGSCCWSNEETLHSNRSRGQSSGRTLPLRPHERSYRLSRTLIARFLPSRLSHMSLSPRVRPSRRCRIRTCGKNLGRERCPLAAFPSSGETIALASRYLLVEWRGEPVLL